MAIKPKLPMIIRHLLEDPVFQLVLLLPENPLNPANTNGRSLLPLYIYMHTRTHSEDQTLFIRLLGVK